MRAVKTVLNSVASFCLKHPDFVASKSLASKDGEEDDDENDGKAEEYSVIVKAMVDTNLPKFVDEDVPLFKGIIKDMFPDVKPPAVIQ